MFVPSLSSHTIEPLFITKRGKEQRKHERASERENDKR